MGLEHIRNLLIIEHARVVAIADNTASMLSAAAQLLPGGGADALVTADYHQLLASPPRWRRATRTHAHAHAHRRHALALDLLASRLHPGERGRLSNRLLARTARSLVTGLARR